MELSFATCWRGTSTEKRVSFQSPQYGIIICNTWNFPRGNTTNVTFNLLNMELSFATLGFPRWVRTGDWLSISSIWNYHLQQGLELMTKKKICPSFNLLNMELSFATVTGRLVVIGIFVLFQSPQYGIIICNDQQERIYPACSLHFQSPQYGIIICNV